MGVVPVQGPQLPAVPGGVFINMSARAGYGISGGFLGKGTWERDLGSPAGRSFVQDTGIWAEKSLAPA